MTGWQDLPTDVLGCILLALVAEDPDAAMNLITSSRWLWRDLSPDYITFTWIDVSRVDGPGAARSVITGFPAQSRLERLMLCGRAPPRLMSILSQDMFDYGVLERLTDLRELIIGASTSITLAWVCSLLRCIPHLRLETLKITYKTGPFGTSSPPRPPRDPFVTVRKLVMSSWEEPLSRPEITYLLEAFPNVQDLTCRADQAGYAQLERGFRRLSELTIPVAYSSEEGHEVPQFTSLKRLTVEILYSNAWWAVPDRRQSGANLDVIVKELIFNVRWNDGRAVSRMADWSSPPEFSLVLCGEEEYCSEYPMPSLSIDELVGAFVDMPEEHVLGVLRTCCGRLYRSTFARGVSRLAMDFSTLKNEVMHEIVRLFPNVTTIVLSNSYGQPHAHMATNLVVATKWTGLARIVVGEYWIMWDESDTDRLQKELYSVLAPVAAKMIADGRGLVVQEDKSEVPPGVWDSVASALKADIISTRGHVQIRPYARARVKRSERE